MAAIAPAFRALLPSGATTRSISPARETLPRSWIDPESEHRKRPPGPWPAKRRPGRYMTNKPGLRLLLAEPGVDVGRSHAL